MRCVHVAERDSEARATAAPALLAAHPPRANLPGEPDPLGFAIVGDAERCRETIAEILERTGADTLVAWHDFGAAGQSSPPELAMASQRRLIEQVAPSFG